MAEYIDQLSDADAAQNSRHDVDGHFALTVVSPDLNGMKMYFITVSFRKSFAIQVAVENMPRDHAHVPYALKTRDPLLLKHTGRRLKAGGVIVMFALAIHEYTRGLPHGMDELVEMMPPAFYDALLSEYPSVRDRAKELQARSE